MMKLPGSIVNACLFRLCIVICGPLRFFFFFILFFSKKQKNQQLLQLPVQLT